MRLRRALLVTTAFSTVLMGGAGAAYAQAFDWSGFYVGVGVAGGGGFDGGTLSWDDPENEIWNTPILPPGVTTDSYEPILGGGTLTDFPGAVSGFGVFGSVGFNQQMDNFLFGIEASITSGPFKSEATFVESGDVTFTTSSTDTLYTSTYGTTYYSTIVTTYLTTESVSYSTYTNTTTVTGGATTTTSLYTATFTTFQTTTVINDSTTIEYPTTSSYTTTVTSTTGTITTETNTTYTASNETTFATGTTVVSYSTNGEWNETITGRAQIDWLATIKGRIGITADRTLFFATGGLAVAGVTQETSATLTIDGPGGPTTTNWSGSNSETRFGFVVGGGIEHALDDHWIISGEAEYFNLGTAEYDVVSEDSDIIGHQTQVLDGGSVKLGIKYKF